MLMTEWKLDDVLEVWGRQSREEGREEGLVEGIEKGIKKGLTEGVFKVARNALKEGLPMEMIQKITGIDINSIRQLTAN